jgi:myo-inositol-1(or 4)-monophosphatase
MIHELSVAIQIATSAGALVRERFGKSNSVWIKEDHSLVSEADIVSHDYIVSALTSAFPAHATLSEESADALRTNIQTKPTWVIDPLDGTSNFLSQIPLFAVALALIENEETRVGVIYDPIHEELFAAEKGHGTTLNGVPVFVSKKEIPRGAMLFAGRGYKKHDQQRHANIICELERQTTYFRRLGSATIMLAYVACGRADTVILTGNNPWDTLTGAFLVEEAGGQISDYCGHAWKHTSEDLVATNGIMHSKLIEITSNLKDACGHI